MRDGENCLLPAPASVDALQAAINHLLTNPAMATQLGQQARQTVCNHLNVDKMADALLSIIQETAKI
jgi:glycosyltransferase involved in cell wall biosynthesis